MERKKRKPVPNTAEALIRIVDLHKSYYDGETELPVLQVIDFDLNM